MGILGFPQAARHAQGIPDRTVRLVAAVRPQLWYEYEPLAVIRTVGRQAVLERRADVFLVVDATELDEFSEFTVLTVYVRESRHEVVGAMALTTWSAAPPVSHNGHILTIKPDGHDTPVGTAKMPKRDSSPGRAISAVVQPDAE